ncbi:MAG: pseudoazurin [Flavobacteriaceae bacterium]|nr:pseudoazurin [Flavobacteriaceae bacterium]
MGAQPVETNVNKVTLSEGSEHEVKMLNSGADGIMVFEPAVIKVSKGDTIHFKAVDMSHNSASVDGMIPAGANSWNGTINQDISITLDQEGVYVYQCTPHAMMAMVGVIQVGEAVNMDDVISAADTKKSGFVSNTDRLDEYLSRL